MGSFLLKYSIVLFGCLTISFSESIFESEDANQIKDAIMEVSKLNPRENMVISKWMDNCENKLGPEEWNEVKVITSQIYPCMRRYIKPKVAKEEIEDSVDRGDLDLVFKKYCGRKEKILNCLYERLDRIKPCMDNGEMENMNITRTAINAGVEFICSESGDKIALFMAEKGTECVSENQEQIKDCLNKYFPDISKSMKDIKSIQFDHLFIRENTCSNFTSAKNCIIDVMLSCQDPTPSNILDSLMTQALKVTPCVQTSSSMNNFRMFISQILHPYLLTAFVGILTATHIIL